MTEARIAPLAPAQLPLWVALRCELWPDASETEHADEAQMLMASTNYRVLLAFDGATPAGFAEAALRRDYVNGCDSSPAQPVAFLEGIYVRAPFRRRGMARALIDDIAAWARTRGVVELASDALLDNHDSHAMHRALGFAETERIVFFRRRLDE